MAEDFDVSPQSISEIAQRSESRSSKGSHGASALICRQGSPDICAAMVKHIITSVPPLWIPLDVHLSSPKAIS